MSKFDRGVFIFIGLGVWELVMTQVLKPSSAIAVDNSCGSWENPCKVTLQNLELGNGLTTGWVLSDVNKGTKIWSK